MRRSRPSVAEKARRSASRAVHQQYLPRPDEAYLPHYDPLRPPIASSQHPYQVPPGEFYLLGDNRANSCDSRYWGPIKGSGIIGKVVLVWWHDDHPDFHRF